MARPIRVASGFFASRSTGLAAIAFVASVQIILTGCSKAIPTLTSLSSEIQGPVFEGVSDVKRDIFTIIDLQAFAANCDARIVNLAVSTDGTVWNDARTFFDTSSDLNCADGNMNLKVRPNVLSFGTGFAEGVAIERRIYIRGQTEFGVSPLGTIRLIYHPDFTGPVVGGLVPTSAVAGIPVGTYASNSEITALMSLQGTCTAGDGKVTIVWKDNQNRQLPSEAPCAANGTFVQPLVNLIFMDDGLVTVTASQVTDAAGNAGNVASATFTKDVVAPALVVVAPLANSYITASTMAAFVSSGTCSPGDGNVTVTFGPITDTAVACATDGTWSKTSNLTAVPDGPYVGTVSQTDVAGNVTSSSSTLTKDTVVPTLTALSGANTNYANIANSASYRINGNCSEETKQVTITAPANMVGTAAAICTSGAFSIYPNVTGSADNIAPGVTITFSHIDAAGNTGTNTLTIRKDTAAPTITINTPLSNTGIVNKANYRAYPITGACSDSTQVLTIVEPAGAAFTTSVTCVAGNYSGSVDFLGVTDTAAAFNLKVKISDPAGNDGFDTKSVVMKDIVDPLLTISSVLNGGVITIANVATFKITGTCSEVGRAITVIAPVSPNNPAPTSVNCAAGNVFDYTANYSAIADTTTAFTVKLEHIDSAGNSKTADASFVKKDTVAPVITISSRTNVGVMNKANVVGFAFSGTCNENGKIPYFTAPAAVKGVVASACAAGAYTISGDFTDVADSATGFDATIALADDVGNVGQVTTVAANKVTLKDTVDPVVAVSSVTPTTINNANKASIVVAGTCSEAGTITITAPAGIASNTGPCSSGTFSINANFTGVADSVIGFPLSLSQTDAAGNTGVSTSSGAGKVVILKDTVDPTTLTAVPAASGDITQGNMATYQITGTCSENSQSVSATGPAGMTTTPTTCSSGTYTLTTDFTTVALGAHTLTVTHVDLAGNIKTVTASVTRRNVYLTMNPSYPNSGWVNAANQTAYVLSGTCSENGQPVSVVTADSGGATGTYTCASNLYAIPVNFTSVTDGASKTVKLTHGTSSAITVLTVSNPANTVSKDIIAPTAGTFAAFTTNSATLTVSPTIKVTGTTDTGANPSGVKQVALDIAEYDTPFTSKYSFALTSVSSPAWTGLAGGIVVTPTSVFDNLKRYKVSIVATDVAGNSSGSLPSDWDYCPYYTKVINAATDGHANAGDDYATTYRIPLSCGAGSIVMEAVGEKGRQQDGSYISQKGRGAGGAASGIFDAASLAGKTINVEFRGAGLGGGATASTSATSNLGSGGRVAFAYAPLFTSYVAGGGGGGLGSDFTATDSATTDDPGVGGQAGAGQGKCDVSGAAGARTTCGINGNSQATVDIGSGGAAGVVSCVAGSFTAPTAGLDTGINSSSGDGGQGLKSGGGTRHGGGGGAGFGGGGGGGGKTDAGVCAGTSGGGGGSVVNGQVAGTATGLVGGVGNGAPVVRITIGVPKASTICPANFIYIPPVESYATNSTSARAGFCMAKYEAADDGTGKAISAPNKLPWSNIKLSVAQQACIDSSTRLISNSQWQTVAQIEHWRRDNWSAEALGGDGGINIGVLSTNIAAPTTVAKASSGDANPCSGTTATCDLSTWSVARRTHSVSNDAVVWDMGGNVSEYTSTLNPFIDTGFINIVVLSSYIEPDYFSVVTPTANYVWKGSSLQLGLGATNLMNAPANPIYRGGHFQSSSVPHGIFRANVGFSAENDASINKGFRCVTEPVATGF